MDRHELYIRALLTFSPSTFFNKLNQLDWYQSTLQQWVNQLNLTAGSQILEAGCATGILCDALDKQGYKMTGVDASEKMIAKAIPTNHATNFHIADVTKMPFQDECFNAVISASLINIVNEQQSMLEEIKRVCKPEGIISMLVPARKFTDSDLLDLIETLGISGFSAAAMRSWHKLAPKMDEDELQLVHKNAGLGITTITHYLQGMVISSTALTMP